jgi:uncharacterized membrane protein
LVIHFPIALLLFAPLFVAVALIFPANGRWASWAAALLLIGGTAAAFLSVATGEAARGLVGGSDVTFNTLTRHEQLAKLSRTAFVVLTGAYVVLLALPLLWKKLSGAYFHVVTHFIFLVALLGAGLLLANAAHLGGRLVHEFGVHADWGAAPADSKKADGPESESPKQPEEEPDEPPSESPKAAEEKPKGPEAESPRIPAEKPDESPLESPKKPEEKPDEPESERPKAPEEKSETANP